MSKVTSFVPPEPEPEPEQPKSLEERITDYRNDYRSLLKRTATVLILPRRKAKAVLVAALAK